MSLFLTVLVVFCSGFFTGKTIENKQNCQTQKAMTLLFQKNYLDCVKENDIYVDEYVKLDSRYRLCIKRKDGE